MQNLTEERRSQLISQPRNAQSYASDNQLLGKNRYQRRLRSKVQNSVKEMNSIDMNKLFKDNILDVNVNVKGETNNYIVSISFGGILELIQEQLQQNGNDFKLKVVIRALINAFNSDNVYVRCSCPDFQFTQAYYLSVNDVILGEKENIPSDITNPNDTKGRGCKHILLVLSNNSWLTKVGSVVYNYVNYMKKHYQKLYSDIIYPAIYNKEYEEPVQLRIDDETENAEEQPLETDPDLIDVSNKWAATKNQFKPGNEYRFTKSNKPSEKQFDFDSLVSNTST